MTLKNLFTEIDQFLTFFTESSSKLKAQQKLCTLQRACLFITTSMKEPASKQLRVK